MGQYKDIFANIQSYKNMQQCKAAVRKYKLHVFFYTRVLLSAIIESAEDDMDAYKQYHQEYNDIQDVKWALRRINEAVDFRHNATPTESFDTTEIEIPKSTLVPGEVKTHYVFITVRDTSLGEAVSLSFTDNYLEMLGFLSEVADVDDSGDDYIEEDDDEIDDDIDEENTYIEDTDDDEEESQYADFDDYDPADYEYTDDEEDYDPFAEER